MRCPKSIQISLVWNRFTQGCVQNHMGTLTIPMTTIGLPAGWMTSTGSAAKVVKIASTRRKADAAKSASAPEPVVRLQGDDLPVVRDNRGTLLPLHGEASLLRTTPENADQEPWR